MKHAPGLVRPLGGWGAVARRGAVPQLVGRLLSMLCCPAPTVLEQALFWSGLLGGASWAALGSGVPANLLLLLVRRARLQPVRRWPGEPRATAGAGCRLASRQDPLCCDVSPLCRRDASCSPRVCRHTAGCHLLALSCQQHLTDGGVGEGGRVHASRLPSGSTRPSRVRCMHAWTPRQLLAINGQLPLPCPTATAFNPGLPHRRCHPAPCLLRSFERRCWSGTWGWTLAAECELQAGGGRHARRQQTVVAEG